MNIAKPLVWERVVLNSGEIGWTANGVTASHGVADNGDPANSAPDPVGANLAQLQEDGIVWDLMSTEFKKAALWNAAVHAAVKNSIPPT